MRQGRFKHRKDIIEHLKEVATDVQGNLELYNQKAGHLRQGMVHLRKAYIFVAKGDFENAAKESKESVRYLSDCIEAIRAAADSQCFIGQYKQAIKFYSDLTKKYPDTKDIHYQIGWCYSQLKEYPKAIDEFQKEISISGDSAEIHLQLGFAIRMSGQQIYEELTDKQVPVSNDVRRNYRSRLNEAKVHYQKALGAVEQKTIDSWISEINQILQSL